MQALAEDEKRLRAGKRIARIYCFNVLDKRTRFPIITITTNNDNFLLF